MLNINRRNMLASTAAIGLFATSPANSASHRRKHPGANLPISLTLNNLDSSNGYAAPNVSYGHAFADGDVSHGGSVTMLDSSNNPVVVQMDAVSLWPSGCPRFVVLSHACAETFGPATSVTYTIGSSTTTPNNTPSTSWGNSPEATMAANTNFTIQYSGFDAGRNTYTVSLNKIFSTYPSYPWGTHFPQGGWERTKVGPVCIEWHAWQYLANDANSKPQGYVRCDMWIKAWSPAGPFEIDVRTSQPNMWNAISEKSERYNKSPGRWATLCVVKNGSSIIQNAGGPSDYRTTTIPNADFNTSTCQITAAFNTLFPQQGIVFASTGSLPTGINPNTIFWLAYNGQPNPYICGQRAFAATLEQIVPTAWTPNTSYSSSYGGTYVKNGNIVYACVQAGTSGSGSGPTGTGNHIIDGSCKWENATIPFTDQGSGTITAYPVNACFPSTAWSTGDPNGNPLWSGSGTRPPIFPGHNFSYLTTQSQFVPSYNIAAGFQTTDQSINIYAPNQNFGGITWYQDTTGDGAGDQRIGYVNGWGATTLYNPGDPFYVYGQIQSALCFSNYPYSYMIDERAGLPFCANNGPHKDGRPYRNLPKPTPEWSGNCTPGNPPAFGVGNWLPWSTKFRDQNGYCGQYYADPSHMPAAWQIAYLKTGRPCFLEQGIHMGNTNCFMLYITQATLGNATYYCVVNTSYNSCVQERAWAWALRSLCQALYIAPASHAFQPVLADYYDDNAAYQALYYTSYVPPQAKTFGFLNVADHGNGAFAPWERSFLILAIAMEVWRGGLTGSRSGKHWEIVLDYMNAMWNVFGANLPGSMYYSGVYSMVYSPNPQGLSTSYQTAIDVLNATYSSNGQSDLIAPYPSGGLYDANVSGYLVVNNFGENCTWYGSIMRAAMKMVTVAQPRNATVASLMSNLISYTASATDLSTNEAGIQWYGEQNSNIQNYHTFAVF